MKKIFSTLTKKKIIFFPVICFLVLIILTAFGIHGSSIGIYGNILWGTDDKALIFNKPQTIRSDEWIVNTQKALSQEADNFQEVNPNLGNGENVTLLADAPYVGWSSIFKPHNLGYLVLPFSNGLSFKWWSMSFILLMGAYFFSLHFLPKKYLLSSLLALAFWASPFVQWWYTYGTLGSIGFGLLCIVFFLNIIKSNNRKALILSAAGLTYSCIAFALCLYPPFQIPVALVAAVICIGYLLNNKTSIDWRKLLILIPSGFMIILAVGLFVLQNVNVINTVSHTSYPGARVVQSGGYSLSYLASTHLGGLLQFPGRIANFSYPEIGATNQSELSGFIFISIFLIPWLIYYLVQTYYRKKVIDYQLLLPLILTIVFFLWLFVPGLALLGKFTLLDKVPHQRLLIGLGLLNIFYLVYFIQKYRPSTNQKFSLIALFGSIIYLAIANVHISHSHPGLLGLKMAFLIAVILACIIYLLYRSWYQLAIGLLAVFSLASIYKIHPLSIGTSILTDDPLIHHIQAIDKSKEGYWISDYFPIENFVTMAGGHSLNGTYTYPQVEIWDKLGIKEDAYKYNRYAHTSFTFDRSPSFTTPQINQAIADQFNVYIEPCDGFFKKTNVKYLITTLPISKEAGQCLTSIDQVSYPVVKFYIYRITE